MSSMKCDPTADVLLVVDLQVPFLDVIHEGDRVLRRSSFLIRAARALHVPVIATEQAPERLGRTEAGISAALAGAPVVAKTEFSAAANPAVQDELRLFGRKHVVVVGVETHICICGTVLDLLDLGYRVTVCPDAVSSRMVEAHKLGMERIRDAGAMPGHTESVAYEWLGSSQHPAFKQVLDLVKSSPL